MKKQILLLCLLWASAQTLPAQVLRNSLLQYQFNPLPINPAYSGKTGSTGFESAWFGNFAGEEQEGLGSVSVFGRSGGHPNLGLGGVFEFYHTAFFDEVALHPSFARWWELPVGKIGFGASVGFRYVDFSAAVDRAVNIFSVSGNLGVYFHTGQFFTGVSMVNFVDGALFLPESAPVPIAREKPVYLHSGWTATLSETLQVQPVVLLKYATYYSQPAQASDGTNWNWSYEVQSNLIFEETYIGGLLFGTLKLDDGRTLNRFGISATTLFGNLRLGYAIQRNSIGWSLEISPQHLLVAAYEFN